MADLEDHHPFAVEHTGAASVEHTGATSDELDAAEQAPLLDELTRARALLAAQPVVEGHTDPPRVFDPEDLLPVRVAEVGAQLWSLRVEPDEDAADVIGTLRRIDGIRALVDACPEDLRLATTTAEMAHAVNCGRVGVVLGPVSWSALAGSIAALRAYHALGVRAVNLTRFDGFAREAVREMNRLGLVVDLSGADADSVRRTLALTRTPVLLTRADPEELPDDVLGLLGRNGGVCMVPVTEDPSATADVLDRVRALAGPQCVGLSHTTALAHVTDLSQTTDPAHTTDLPHATDLAHTTGLPPATDPADGYAPLFAELLRRDWPASDLVALSHDNATRALREAEFHSRSKRLRHAA
ncbi:membrane dipeptidase [Streptomyces sp. NPDC050848]|uniref:membrane dipeptidase n=1 Tax=Streptomyces sp. NPDC050848 TaxID=3155791 RepID=UPI00340A40D0